MASPVGPPWLITISGGRSPGGPAKPGFAGSYTLANAVTPPSVGNSIRDGTDTNAGSNGISALTRRTSTDRALKSSQTSSSGRSGHRPRTRSGTPPPPWRDPSAGRCGADRGPAVRRSPDRAPPASGCRPVRTNRRSARPPRTRRTVMPNTQCGNPNSASMGHKACRSPSTMRSRFHQPVRSLAKCSTPAGLQSGAQIDSSPSAPATRRRFDTEPSSPRSPTNSSQPSQGIHGRSQARNASLRAVGRDAGVRIEISARRRPSLGVAPPSSGSTTSSFTTSAVRLLVALPHADHRRPSAVMRPSA